MAGIKEYFISVKESFRALKWYEWLMAAVMVAIALWSMVSAFINPDDGGNPPWLTVVNFISAVCGVLCIFFTAKAHISNFPFSIVNTVVYIVYLAYWKIYGTMCLELFIYLPVGIASWIAWAKHRDEKENARTKARSLKVWQNALTAAVVIACAVIYHAALVRVGGNVAWLDAFTVSIGIMAIILEMLRYREQYIWWLITDFVAVAMYIAHFDTVYLTKKLIYLIMAVVGLVNWIRLSRINEENT